MGDEKVDIIENLMQYSTASFKGKLPWTSGYYRPLGISFV
jgi:hypothetical protein